jgi:uncharacterized cupredoxin-like copper-binding protein
MKHFHEPSPTRVAGTVTFVTAAALASGIALASGAGAGAGERAPAIAQAAKSSRSAGALANERGSAPAVVNAASVQLLLKVNEFHIGPLVNAVPAGRVKITVFNRGTQKHEVIVVNANGRLPIMRSGRVDEAALERKHRIIGEIANVRPGRSGSKTFVLKQGPYMLFCNLPHHYGAGMRASLIVRRR